VSRIVSHIRMRHITSKVIMSHINTGENMMAGGKKWCVTDGMCGSALGDGQFFDTCAIPTTRGCSCRRDWMTKGNPVDGYVTLQ